MALFSVRRFTGETTIKEKNVNDNLQKLLQKVEKRKGKQKSKETSSTKNEEEYCPKKRKVDEIDDETVKANDNELLAQSPGAIENDIDPLQESDQDKNDYEVLGEDVNQVVKQQKVDMVLPAWLAHPTIISTSISIGDQNEMELTAIEKLSYLAPHIRYALKDLDVKRLFPVQNAVVPWIMEAHSKPMPFRPRDICVSAPTGSGKTLAFAIPVVQLLANRVERKIRALVVLPVAELALQVFKVFKKLCEKTDLKVALLSKQCTFHLEQQKLVECYKGEFYSKVDIVVTTPGRLVDHLHSTKGFCLKYLKFLVIDEADRIMDAVFQNWLYHLDAHVRTESDQLLSGRSAPLCYNQLQHSITLQPHKLLFSATLSQDPEKLQNLRLFQPKLFTSVLTQLEVLRENLSTAEQEKGGKVHGEFIGKYTTPAELTEKYCITESRLKPLTLFALINENLWTKFLCFTNSVVSSERLAFVLKQLFQTSMSIDILSGTLTAKQRMTVLSDFSRGKINGLICSDALARGIDIPDVDIVVSYDSPRHIKTYIHRIGRTARAGRQGTAVTLLTQKELGTFNQTLSEVGKIITQEITVSPVTEEVNAKIYSNALMALRSKIEKDKRYRLLVKERAKRNIEHKDPAKMTLMEKLQVQVDEQIHEKTIKREEALLSATKKLKTKRKPKKAKK